MKESLLEVRVFVEDSSLEAYKNLFKRQLGLPWCMFKIGMCEEIFLRARGKETCKQHRYALVRGVLVWNNPLFLLCNR